MALWLIGLAVLPTAVFTGGGELSDEDEFISKPESEQAFGLPGAALGSWGRGRVLRAGDRPIEDQSVDEPEFQQTVESIASQLRGANGEQRSAVTYYEARDAADERADLLVYLIATLPSSRSSSASGSSRAGTFDRGANSGLRGARGQRADLQR